jgi:hypothetical protein
LSLSRHLRVRPVGRRLVGAVRDYRAGWALLDLDLYLPVVDVPCSLQYAA